MKTLHTPWPDIQPKEKSDWSKTWPKIKCKAIDPLQEAADYYIHTAIAESLLIDIAPMEVPSDDEVKRAAEILGLTLADIKRRKKMVDEIISADPRIELQKFADDSAAFIKKQMDRLAPSFEEYTHMACGGELRHHSAIGGRTLHGSRSCAWVGWKEIFEKYGTDSLVTMAELFREFDSRTYGNERWAVAAEVLHQYLHGQLGPDPESNKRMFVDRVFTLEHNGGCFLNKVGWKIAADRRARGWDYGVDNMKALLNAHSSNPPDLYTLHNYASDATRVALEEYFDYLNAKGIKSKVNFAVTSKTKKPGAKAAEVKTTPKISVPTPASNKKVGPGKPAQKAVFLKNDKPVSFEDYAYFIGSTGGSSWKNFDDFNGLMTFSIDFTIRNVDGEEKSVNNVPVASFNDLGGWDVKTKHIHTGVAKQPLEFVGVKVSATYNGDKYVCDYEINGDLPESMIYGSSMAYNIGRLIKQQEK